MSPAFSPGPTRITERIQLLDAIRGVALGGILLANLMSFFGADMLGLYDPTGDAAGPASAKRVLFAINWLVEGKFYSIFSMLLGAGFALQAARAARRGANPRGFDAFFRRRMAVLVAIGLVHMYGLWSGDILTLYGVMGLLLPTLARLPGDGAHRGHARAVLGAARHARPCGRSRTAATIRGRRSPPSAPSVREHLGVAGRPALDVFARGTAARLLGVEHVVRGGAARHLPAVRTARQSARAVSARRVAGTSVLPRLRHAAALALRDGRRRRPRGPRVELRLRHHQGRRPDPRS